MQVDQIIAAARTETGLSDIGDPAIMEGLQHLVDALNAEARLTPAGAERWRAQITGFLANRLRVEDYLAKHPSLLRRPIDRPLFVFGLPRTGTTLAINLLASDPARRVFMRWESMAPAPPRESGDYKSDPRFIAEKTRLDMSLKYAPHIATMHFEEADGPTECQFAMAPSFCAQYYDSMADIPSYRRWFFNTSYLPAFRYHKRLLQMLQAHVGGRWTLKNPWHPLYLDDLVAVYPDAQLAMTHRDPAEVVGSACSLIKAVRVMFSDDVDLKAIGEGMIETFDLMIARVRAYKKKSGADAIHDIQYADLMKDPIGEMRKVYQRFDEPFTPQAEKGMRAHLADNPQGKHGKHAYALEDYGLTRAGVRAHFADYIRDFGVKIKD